MGRRRDRSKFMLYVVIFPLVGSRFKFRCIYKFTAFKSLSFESQVLFYGGRRFRDGRRSIVRRIGRELARYQFSLFTKRSIIREIGSRLPLKPCKRPYFEVN